jgi:hypothetical protein
VGTYGAPFVGRRAAVGVIGLCGVWTVVVVAWTVRGAAFSVPFAAYSVVTYLWNSYWFLHRIACRVTLRAGILEWQAPLRTETLWLSDIVSIRAVRLLPSMISIRRHEGDSLLLLVGKGVGALVAEVVGQRPDLDHAVGPWARLVERGPGRSWWRPGRHYATANTDSPVAPWPASPPPVPADASADRRAGGLAAVTVATSRVPRR